LCAEDSEVAASGQKHGSKEYGRHNLQGTKIVSNSVLNILTRVTQCHEHTIGSAHPGSFHAGLLFHLGSVTGTLTLSNICGGVNSRARQAEIPILRNPSLPFVVKKDSFSYEMLIECSSTSVLGLDFAKSTIYLSGERLCRCIYVLLMESSSRKEFKEKSSV
jgi:hypothetical protein